MTLFFKLPDAFVAKHHALLEGWDWRSEPEMVLAEQLPDEPTLARGILEAVPGANVPKAPKDATVIRSKTLASMVAVRNYANAQAVGI